MQEETTHTLLTDVLEIHFLDLQAAKRTKEEVNRKSKRSQLINWLKFIGTSDKEERAMLAQTSPILQMLNEKVNVLSLSPVEKKLYESRMKLKSDITTLSEAQYSAGIEQGKSLGLAEGSRQKALETARILKQFGDSTQKIVQATGLTPAEIETLK